MLAHQRKELVFRLGTYRSPTQQLSTDIRFECRWASKRYQDCRRGRPATRPLRWKQWTMTAAVICPHFLLTVFSFPTAEASAVRMISSGQFLAQDGQLERPVGMKPYILRSHSPAALLASLRQPWRVPKSGRQDRRMPLGQPSYFFPLGRHLAFSRSCFVDVTRPVIVGVSSRSNMVNLFQWQTSVARG